MRYLLKINDNNYELPCIIVSSFILVQNVIFIQPSITFMFTYIQTSKASIIFTPIKSKTTEKDSY